MGVGWPWGGLSVNTWTEFVITRGSWIYSSPCRCLVGQFGSQALVPSQRVEVGFVLELEGCLQLSRVSLREAALFLCCSSGQCPLT